MHHENPTFPGRWCVAVPKTRREGFIREAHDERFVSCHFVEKRIYGKGIGGQECRLMSGSIAALLSVCVYEG